jgi:hypothetical protein
MDEYQEPDIVSYLDPHHKWRFAEDCSYERIIDCTGGNLQFFSDSLYSTNYNKKEYSKKILKEIARILKPYGIFYGDNRGKLVYRKIADGKMALDRMREVTKLPDSDGRMREVATLPHASLDSYCEPDEVGSKANTHIDLSGAINDNTTNSCDGKFPTDVTSSDIHDIANLEMRISKLEDRIRKLNNIMNII